MEGTMFILLDDRTMDQRKAGSGKVAGIDVPLDILQIAEYVVIVKDETYEVVKDRMTGATGEFPLEELPELIKQRLIERLKIRDQIKTDE